MLTINFILKFSLEQEQLMHSAVEVKKSLQWLSSMWNTVKTR